MSKRTRIFVNYFIKHPILSLILVYFNKFEKDAKNSHFFIHLDGIGIYQSKRDGNDDENILKEGRQ